MRRAEFAAWAAVLLVVSGCARASIGGRQRTVGAPPAVAAGVSARGGRTVVVMMENHSYSDIIGNAEAPYLNALARGGLSLTEMHAITHPSQPNYLALFSGGTQGVADDSCPQTLTAANLGSELRTAKLSFAGFSEGLPATGSSACTAGRYARKHEPWSNFTDLPASVSRPFTAFPSHYAELPTLSFVIPDLDHDMHDGTIAQADSWMKQNLAGYARWAKRHHSLLIVTWDEDDHSEQNRIPTFITGDGVTPRRLSTRFTLYSLLRTMEDRYRLPRLGASAAAVAVPLH